MPRTPTLTVDDLSGAAIWLHFNDTDDLDDWAIRWEWAPDEAAEWIRCYGDLARELAGNIQRLIEIEADRMVTAEIQKAVTK